MKYIRSPWQIRSVRLAGLAAMLLTSAGVSAQSATSKSDALEEVVVTGIRASVQAAQDVKRLAPSVVEAITLEDLGKFTDSSISDALQRLPGINIDRSLFPQGGTQDSVAIRGLSGSAYGSTTINGRDALGTTDFFGGGGRGFDFASVPPDILGAVTVYKTSTAELVEPGMAGQVDLKTLRPLDYAAKRPDDYFGSISASGSKYSGEHTIGPRINGVIGGKWLDGTLGAYVSVISSTDHIRASQFQTYNDKFSLGVMDASGAVKQYNNVWSTWGTDNWLPDLKYEKFSSAGGIQFKPNQNLDVNLDFIQNHYTIAEDAQADYYQSSGIFSLSPTTIAQPGAVAIGGSAVPGVSDGGLTYFDTSRISNLAPPGGNSGSFSYDAPFDDHSNYHYFVGGLNAVWKSDSGRWRVSGDVAHSDNDYFATWRRPYIQNGIGGENAYDTQGSGIPRYTFYNSPATDVSNPSSYTSYAFVENFQKQFKGNRNSYRLDLAVKFTDGLTGKFGVNYTASAARFISMNYDPSTYPTSLQNIFPGGSTQLPGWPATIPNVSFAAFCAANISFCNQSNEGRGSFNGGFPGKQSTTSGPGVAYVPATPGDIYDLNVGESYELHEQNTALYGQLDFKGDFFDGLKYSGNAGLRAVREQTQGTAFRGVITTVGFTSGGVVSSVTAPFTDEFSYWKYLPSVNFSLIPRDNMALRFGMSKTISLATPQQLAPFGTVRIVVPDAGGFAQPSDATTHNTRLQPTSAWNYDITAEYYTSYGGAYIASVFYKDVKDLVTNVVEVNQIIPGQGSRLFTVNSTINGAAGHASGFELGTNQPFTFLPAPWDGFGVQLNYTYVDTKTNVTGVDTSFVGSSKNNANVNAYFEKFGFAARVAYSYRSDFVAGFGGGITIERPETQLDVSLSYKFLTHLEMIVTGSNLTGQGLYQDSQQAGYLLSYAERPRSYSVGLRASF